MNAVWALWVLARVGRWVSWLGLFAYSLNVIFDPTSHITWYGNVVPSTELKISDWFLLASSSGSWN
jgi:hypothetical protein